MCQEGRTNMHNDKCKRQLSLALDETVQYICTLLKDDFCLTITNMQRKMEHTFYM